MRMRFLTTTVAIATIAFALSAAKGETLKYGGFGSGKSPFYTFGVKPFVKRVEAKSKDGLKVQLYLNTLGRATELYENTKNGLADLSWIIASAQRGFKFPRSEVLSLPFVLDGYTNAQASTALWKLYEKAFMRRCAPHLGSGARRLSNVFG